MRPRKKHENTTKINLKQMAFDMVTWIQLVHGTDQIRTVLLQEVNSLSGWWQSLSGCVVRVSVCVSLMSTTQSLPFCMISETFHYFYVRASVMLSVCHTVKKVNDAVTLHVSTVSESVHLSFLKSLHQSFCRSLGLRRHSPSLHSH